VRKDWRLRAVGVSKLVTPFVEVLLPELLVKEHCLDELETSVGWAGSGIAGPLKSGGEGIEDEHNYVLEKTKMRSWVNREKEWNSQRGKRVREVEK
jgi:hypothetical protein